MSALGEMRLLTWCSSWLHLGSPVRKREKDNCLPHTCPPTATSCTRCSRRWRGLGTSDTLCDTNHTCDGWMFRSYYCCYCSLIGQQQTLEQDWWDLLQFCDCAGQMYLATDISCPAPSSSSSSSSSVSHSYSSLTHKIFIKSTKLFTSSVLHILKHYTKCLLYATQLFPLTQYMKRESQMSETLNTHPIYNLMCISAT